MNTPTDDDSSAGGFSYELISKPHLDWVDLQNLGELQKDQLVVLRRSHRERMKRMLLPEWKRSLGKLMVFVGQLCWYALIAGFGAICAVRISFAPVIVDTLALWSIPLIFLGGSLIVWGNKLQGREM